MLSGLFTGIINQYQKNKNMKENKLDICIVTYNRLPYLQNCVWSILASTQVDYRLTVLSDNSTDGTNEWLLEMKSYGKIDNVIINEENLGTAASFNRAINSTSSEFFVMACDDMWFHRDWDHASISLLNTHKDAGIVTFFNFPINPTDSQLKKISDAAYYRQSTGLGASLIKRELFDKAGQFQLPEGLKMGYFARDLCKRALGVNIKRKKQYLTNPFYAEQMDRHNPGSTNPNPPKLSQEYLFKEYNIRRSSEKNKFKNR
jgi:glycosyltransferase involved in cell wall biosynthesis